jgi:hypothetical protein
MFQFVKGVEEVKVSLLMARRQLRGVGVQCSRLDSFLIDG